MNKSQRIINILIGGVFCAFAWYGCWVIPGVLGGDISLDEMIAQNPSVETKVWVWRIVTTLLVGLLFAWIIKKNLQPKK